MDKTIASDRRIRDGSGKQEIPPKVQERIGDGSGAQESPPKLQEKAPSRVPNDPSIGNTLFDEFWDSMTLLDQAVTAQANRGEVAPTNPLVGLGDTRVREFLRMNLSEFYGSKVGEDHNEFIDEMYKVLAIIGVSSIEKADLAAYQLKDVSQILSEQW
ncbi:hypothetical protein EJD97_017547 [Solanum chilense]|uniref:Uncharacterized protein n=1 Tax=Solanum chilense TaxID=4083 RepID=A0A6N2CDW1_SOLCI|nr:hypothetical protein EJD97_017547 [Solanum chilense]